MRIRVRVKVGVRVRLRPVAPLAANPSRLSVTLLDL